METSQDSWEKTKVRSSFERATEGFLGDQVKKHGGSLPEPFVRRCTRSIMEGLKHIHEQGFVHFDVKLQNVLVSDDEVKIADFGLTKEKGKKQGKCEFRGTSLFMSPKSVKNNEYEPLADIWALGCTVVEMVTGKPVWDVSNGSSIWSLIIRIGVGEELPKITEELSEEGKDFLEKCFVKDPKNKWSVEMLLKHPFIKVDSFSFEKVHQPLLSPSPRTHFDFPDWASTIMASLPSSLDSDEHSGWTSSPESRLQQLVTDKTPENWSGLDGWIGVR
ncbi:mitogen-activated protein kinase kinase kinase 20-like [Vigna umbellata]|uniref:mitogen-activated protein kinase kinase kinase 20-like n=1 Tax=Vigna umbellata TaxID=87088 RepID=UPI001F5F761D|nr:mitogen-activated protein kinase kinase kinase 20-like [Vigna umbellata]